MTDVTLTLTVQEANTIVMALQRTDPTGMYAVELIKKIVEQGNAQLPNPPPEVKEVTE